MLQTSHKKVTRKRAAPHLNIEITLLPSIYRANPYSYVRERTAMSVSGCTIERNCLQGKSLLHHRCAKRRENR